MPTLQMAKPTEVGIRFAPQYRHLFTAINLFSLHFFVSSHLTSLHIMLSRLTLYSPYPPHFTYFTTSMPDFTVRHSRLVKIPSLTEKEKTVWYEILREERRPCEELKNWPLIIQHNTVPDSHLT